MNSHALCRYIFSISHSSCPSCLLQSAKPAHAAMPCMPCPPIHCPLNSFKTARDACIYICINMLCISDGDCRRRWKGGRRHFTQSSALKGPHHHDIERNQLAIEVNSQRVNVYLGRQGAALVYPEFQARKTVCLSSSPVISLALFGRPSSFTRDSI